MIIIVSIKKKRIGTITTEAPRLDTAILWLLCFFLLGYFLRSPTLAAASVKSALGICASSLIPSLFPFIVLVGIMNGSGLSATVARLIGRPIGKLFGIREEAVYALLLGCVGGFPIGALCVRELYDSGTLEKCEAERLLGYVNNASPAFCIGTLGMSLFGSTAFGIRLFLCQLVAAFAVGLTQRRRISLPSHASFKPPALSTSDTITNAVATGGLTMLKICSFAIFFAVLGDAACLVADRFLGGFAAALCASICELTLAGRRLAALSGIIPELLCAFAVGWSGISVHMQTASVLSGSGIGMKRYYISKLAQGILSTAFLFLSYLFCGGL
ncbi:MAG: hypothetical protein IJ428_00460 [Clostridia bacterium]|nr:hypothetical protein [Clostridia bacterium]